MNSQPSTAEWIVIVWFVASIVILVAEQIAFFVRLRRLGIRIPFGLGGTPVISDLVYIRQSSARGEPPESRRLRIRMLLVLNAAAAAVSFWLVAAEIAHRAK
jgi:hypothetical protein